MMNDAQTKHFLKNIEIIAKSLNALVKLTKEQNELTLAMINAAESSDEDVSNDYEDYSAVDADDELEEVDTDE